MEDLRKGEDLWVFRYLKRDVTNNVKKEATDTLYLPTAIFYIGILTDTYA